MRLSRSNWGFSLVELLVAMAVGSVLVLGAFSVVQQGSSGYQRISTSMKLRVESREALTQLSRDFGAFQPGHIHWDKDSGGSWRKDEVRFLARLPLSAQDKTHASNSLCRVTYLVRGVQDEKGRVIQSLYRHTEASETVLNTLLSGGEFSQGLPPQDELGLIAFDVLSFEIDFFVRRVEGPGLREFVPGADRAPDVVKLRLRVVGEEIAAKLRTASDWERVTSPLGTVEDVDDNRIDGVETFRLTLSLNPDD